MDQEVHFCQKFTNMKSHWVRVEGPFLPAPLNDSNEVEDLLVEPKSDHVLGNCLRVQDFSCDFGYGIQTNGEGGLDSNSKQGGEHELKFGDLDQLLDDANEVGEFHATNNLSSTYAEVAENSFRQNRGLQLGNSSSASKSQGPSRSDTDAFGISELSATMVMEDEFNNTPVERGLTHELSPGLRTKGSCSRERRLRKPTRRYIEEFADSKSENNKGRRKPPTKDKYLKVTSTEESNHIRHEVQMLTPRSELHCGTSVPVQSRSQRRHPKKHVPVSGFLSEDESSATECKNVYSSTKRCKKYDRRRHQKMWSLTEVMRLVDGIAEYGTGRWTQIKKHLFASSPHRTPIDLRDKWRNLLRASCVNIQNRKGIERKQSHASRPLPKSLLQRVYELANIYPYPKERSPKSVKATTPPMHLIESNSLSFNWGRKKYE
ncbi:uncharacterized protein LOC120073047 isoform X4 [Benincasa hispida]|uniref:uncharacterized protein LOC120073047 isoform X4 n=1 Tax=Benincasa hispida TaxID=102211 RepID=UPI0018FFFFD1|nr:uncharacterized protein LOC120073047 isoform X4 [Benincasa hispida]